MNQKQEPNVINKYRVETAKTNADSHNYSTYFEIMHSD